MPLELDVHYFRFHQFQRFNAIFTSKPRVLHEIELLPYHHHTIKIKKINWSEFTLCWQTILFLGVSWRSISQQLQLRVALMKHSGKTDKAFHANFISLSFSVSLFSLSPLYFIRQKKTQRLSKHTHREKSPRPNLIKLSVVVAEKPFVCVWLPWAPPCKLYAEAF